MIHKKWRNAEPSELSGSSTNDGKVWSWFDRFFGVVDKSVDVYRDIRTPIPNDPYAAEIYAGQMRRQNNTLLIIGGVLVAGVVIYAVVKK